MPEPGERAAGLLGRLRRRGGTLAVAESLTGGLLSAVLTEAPGASATYRGGVCAYAVEVKAAVLGVAPGVLREHGAVSAETAAAMARGARERLGATHALSTTGVAGPDPQEGRPVGTVFVAVADDDGVQTLRLSLTGDRAQIRRQTCLAALDLLGRRLDSSGSSADG